MTDQEILVHAYLALQEKASQLESEKRILRDQIRAGLGSTLQEPGESVVYGGVGKIEVVKGRTTTKLDRGKLVRSGVTAAILDGATTTKTGEPSLRITAPKEE